MSPRKVRLVSNLIKGQDVLVVKSQLEYLVKKSARPISKLLDSAMANAQNNFGLVKENLFIKDIIVNEGTKLKRFRPKGFGSTSPIEKKTSHIRIVLEERVAGLKAGEEAPTTLGVGVPTGNVGKKIETNPLRLVGDEAREKTKHTKQEVQKELGKKETGKVKRLFRRKAI